MKLTSVPLAFVVFAKRIARIVKRMFFVALLLGALISSYAAASETPELVRLPSITQKWGIEAESGVPETTIGEIERCMENDQQIGRDRQVLEHELSQLKEDGPKIQNEADRLARERVQIEMEQKQLLEEQRQVSSQLATLNMERSTIDKAKTQKFINVTAARELKAQITLFNQNVVIYNKAVNGLALRSKASDKHVNAYNSSLKRANAEAGNFNLRATTLKARSDEFDHLLLLQRNKCEGERKLVQ